MSEISLVCQYVKLTGRSNEISIQASVANEQTFFVVRSLPGCTPKRNFSYSARKSGGLLCVVRKVVRWEVSDLFLTVQVAFLDDHLPAGTI